jgi:Na+-transporting NADH:ubiquinone oxidoreductase subunit C
MKLNKESNKYIILYSVALVAAAATLLSLASIGLMPFQQRNVELEKKLNILQSVHKADSIEITDNRNDYIENTYRRYISDSKIVTVYGTEKEGDAFEVNLADEMAKPAETRRLPVFVCTDADSSRRYILPLRGTGLWGAIWGYIALQSDLATVYGAVFDHKGETPGLGAEIATAAFQRQFVGKKIFDNEIFTSIEVKKGKQTQNMPYAVDAISGGTITSEGLQAMLAQGLSQYVPFINAERKRIEEQQAASERARQQAEQEAEAEQPVAPRPRRIIVVPPEEAATTDDGTPAEPAATPDATAEPQAAVQNENSTTENQGQQNE